MWKTFPGCICLKPILIQNGYENKHSLLNINEDKLDRLETEIEKNREIINKLKCDHSKIYDTQPKFKILLGHRSIIIQWCDELRKPNGTQHLHMGFLCENQIILHLKLFGSHMQISYINVGLHWVP